MAVKTQAELLAEVQTILASNSQIRAVDHRTLENDIIDTMFRYKSYVALLTQTSTNAPVVTVLENTLGGNLTSVYNNTGNYSLTSSGLFTLNKTLCFIGSANDGDYGSQSYIASIRPKDVNEIILDTWTISGGSPMPSDASMSNTSIEIRVYP